MATEQPLLAHFIAAEVHAMIAATELTIEIDLDMEAIVEADEGIDAGMKVEVADRYSESKAGDEIVKTEEQDPDVKDEADVKAEERHNTGADQAMSRSNSTTEPNPALVPDAGSEDSSHTKVKDEDTDAWKTASELSSLRSSSPEPPNSELRRISYATPIQVECKCLTWCTCPMHAAHPNSLLLKTGKSRVQQRYRYPHLSEWALSALSYPPAALRTTLSGDIEDSASHGLICRDLQPSTGPQPRSY